MFDEIKLTGNNRPMPSKTKTKPTPRGLNGGRKPIDPNDPLVYKGVRLPKSVVEAIAAKGETVTEAVKKALINTGYGNKSKTD